MARQVGDPMRPTRQIQLQIPSITQDSELNPVSAWNIWRTVWAEIIEETSREFYRLANNNSEITKIFKIHYIAGVTAQMRISFKGTYLYLVGEPINEGEMNKYLLLTCKAVS